MMQASLERIKQDIEALARFSETTGPGCTRFSYSAADRQARAYLADQFSRLGLAVHVDAVGNIRAVRAGTVPGAPAVMTGSHIDTVYRGGRFDGVAGVVCALEAVRVLDENAVATANPVEIIIFVEEEGSNFGSTMAGSKVLTGKYSLADIRQLKNDQGLSMADLAQAAGYEPENLPASLIRPGTVKAMIELHIEQSVVLDLEQVPIGIVEAIYGSRCLLASFKGVANHAGATPMHLRRDPMAAAAGVIARIPGIVRQQAFATTVATVGKITCHPNIINCIPESVAFTIDIRDVNPLGMAIVSREAEALIREMAECCGVDASCTELAASDVIHLSAKVIAAIEGAARKQGVRYRRMNSGAVHDSAMLARVTDVGMIFVPSIGGRSHVPEESTKYEDLKLGCDLLVQTVLTLAQ